MHILLARVLQPILEKYEYIQASLEGGVFPGPATFGGPPVTVGQLVYFDVSCFMRSCSVFLYTFCVYSRKLVHVQ